jgi:DNA recombination protein RmuC
MTPMLEIALLLCLFVALLVIGVLAVMRLQKPPNSASTDPTQNALLVEKLSKIESVIPAIYQTQTDLKSLAERTAQVESSQNRLNQSLITVSNDLAQTGTIARSLADASEAIRTELARSQNDLTELKTNSKARQDLEFRTAESIRRLEAVIAGTHSKGVAGENILDALFSMLPVEWQVRNFRVNDQPCEFGLRLPNNLVLPIDSKWAATNLLEQFIASNDISDKQRLKGQIESVVLAKAKEVRKYIDPNLTVRFGVAAVPDAVYDLCSGLLCETFKYNVVLISYSMFVPYLLLVFQTTLKTSQNIDAEILEQKIQHALDIIGDLRDEVEGRYARAVAMLTNARTDMSASLGRLNSELAALNMNNHLEAQSATAGRQSLDA